MFEKIDEILKELENTISEESMTGGVDGYMTPNAFTKNPMSKSDKKKRKKNTSQGGYDQLAKVYDKYTESINRISSQISKI